jgi:hypothetical protein
MTYGPATSDAQLAAALDTLAHDLADTLTQAQWDALCEAVRRLDITD